MPLIILPLSLLLLSAGVSYAATTPVKVSATVLKLSQCKFSAAVSTLNLGVIDPDQPVDRTASISLIFKCAGSDLGTDFMVVDDYVALERGSHRERKMKHLTIPDSSIPYNISISKTPGEVEKNVDQTITVLVRIKGEDYQNVYSGGYSDVLYISISP